MRRQANRLTMTMSVKTPQSTSIKRACKIDDYLLDANFYKAVVRWALRNMNVQKKKNPSTFHYETTKVYPQAHYKNKYKKKGICKMVKQKWSARMVSVADVSRSICVSKHLSDKIKGLGRVNIYFQIKSNCISNVLLDSWNNMSLMTVWWLMCP